jgi:hypothetical protein
MSEFLEIGLLAIAAEKNRVPDTLKTLKKEVKVGFTKFSLLNLPKQKKIMWIPLNGGIGNEDPFLNPKQPIASMSLRLIKEVPGNYPEAPLTGKGYNINELVTYTEELPLYYPKTEQEFSLLRRRDIKFDKKRAGKQGCPLRYPLKAEELQALGLESKSHVLMVSEPLQKLIQPHQEVPFVFKMPEDEETFVSKGFPDDYNELKTKYNPGDLVTEANTYKAKRICQLKAVDDSDNCYLVKLNEEDSEIIKVIQPNIVETHKRSKANVRRRNLCI